MPDAQEFIESKVQEYEETWWHSAGSRLKALGYGGEEFDLGRFITELDPALLRSDLDSGIGRVASDFVANYNGLLDRAAGRDDVAGSLIAKYRITVAQKTAIESSLRQSCHTLYSALSDLNGARAAYTNFKSSHVQRGLMAMVSGGNVGGLLGNFLLPGVGGILGGALGGWLAAGGIDKQEKGIVQDYVARFDAFLEAGERTWDTLAAQLKELFSTYYGGTLQAFQSEVEAVRRRLRSQSRSRTRVLSIESDNSYRLQAEVADPLRKRSWAWPSLTRLDWTILIACALVVVAAVVYFWLSNR